MGRDEVRLLRWQGPPRTNLGSDTNSAGHRVGEPGSQARTRPEVTASAPARPVGCCLPLRVLPFCWLFPP